jgi:hypothetical protein
MHGGVTMLAASGGLSLYDLAAKHPCMAQDGSCNPSRLDFAPKPRMSNIGKGTAMHRFGYAIAALIAPAFAAGRVRSFSISSKTTAKTTTKTV